MLVKEITYTDLNGVEKTKAFSFNISRSKATMMQASVPGGGLSKRLEAISKAKDGVKIMEFFEEFIAAAYGEPSEDGDTFNQSPELSRKFMQGPAYEVLFEELVTNAESASNFITNVLPKPVGNQPGFEVVSSAGTNNTSH